MAGPARGSYSLSLNGESGDPAQNEKVIALTDKFVADLKALSGGTLYPLSGTCPVNASLSTSFTNDNGESFRDSRSYGS